MTAAAAAGITAGMAIYKIFRASEWAALQAEGRTAGAPVDLADGYIHFSTAEQVAGTLAKHFAGEDGLTILAVDETALGEALRWEPARGDALFPHLYRPLRLDEVAWHAPLTLIGDRHLLPEALG